tara:strand:- start:3392 stop:3661 length:270 start_codon:yes stop_codon:yes gene_type:complete
MIEVFYKDSLFRYSKNERGNGGSWLLVKGQGLGGSGIPYCVVPISFWTELRVAAIEAGFSSSDFAPIVSKKKESKGSKRKTKGPSISIF